jgi:cell wall-associated NlpC family hydrolase
MPPSKTPPLATLSHPAVALTLALALVVSGCSTTVGPRPEQGAAPKSMTAAEHPAVRTAQSQIGIPYRWGGASPVAGFDCSGLVHYAYRQAGVDLPRTTREQFRRLAPVQRRHLGPGDLMFFRLAPGKGMHVGIYVGRAIFIHAPSEGKRVSYASLTNPYWQARFVGGRRVPLRASTASQRLSALKTPDPPTS